MVCSESSIAAAPSSADSQRSVLENVPGSPRPVYTASQYIDRPPVTFLDSDELVPEYGIVMITGKPGIGKSAWVLWYLARIAESRPAILLLAEGIASLPDRLFGLRKLGCTLPDDKFFIVDENINIVDPDCVTSLISDLRPYEPRIVVLDSFSASIVGAEENSAREMTQVFLNVQRVMRELDVAVILIHHDAKNANQYRGSSVIEASVDALYHLTTSGKNLLQLHVVKDRMSGKQRDFNYELESVDVGYHANGRPITAPKVVRTASGAAKSEREEPRLKGCPLEFLKFLGQQNDWVELARIHDRFPSSNSWRELKSLLDRNLIEKSGSRRVVYRITDAGRRALADN